jgi:single-strand DNA-binding protein
MNFARVIIVGRVANTPQLKSFTKQDQSEGARCYFPVAVTRESDRGKKEGRRTSFFDIVAWGNPAKRHAQYLTKGTEVTIEGELIAENITNEKGEFVRKAYHIRAVDVQYGRKPAKDSAPANVDRTRIEALEAQVQALATGKPMTATAPIVDGAEDPFAG